MAIHVHTPQGSRAIGAHLPLNVALAIVPTLPRLILSRLVARAIERLDELDGDADLEPEATEQDDEPEIDDEPELDDHGGGNVEDEGEPESGVMHPACGIYESTGPLSLYAN